MEQLAVDREQILIVGGIDNVSASTPDPIVVWRSANSGRTWSRVKKMANPRGSTRSYGIGLVRVRNTYCLGVQGSGADAKGDSWTE